ncbi:Protein chibby like protein 1 [Myotis davidii]|uniref:Protein chibby like protein 1 n=1 Tax=Myotis davidii TaxID=225400 RepID=L5LMA8_MYODS|nr:Protein chibby like protein 1 [Myotis davidii]
MSLFGKTSTPKTPARKSAPLSNLHRQTSEVEMGLDYGSPIMNLTGESLKCGNGHWVAETGISGSVDHREIQHLRKRNNLLQADIDVLLDKF